MLHILGPVSFLCVALFPAYHLVSLFSKSPSLHRLFLSSLSVLLPTAAKQRGCIFPLKSHLTCDLCFFGPSQMRFQCAEKCTYIKLDFFLARSARDYIDVLIRNRWVKFKSASVPKIAILGKTQCWSYQDPVFCSDQ